MKELYRGKAYAIYGQVALFDAEDTNSYPQWPNEDVSLVFGSKGVAVAAFIDHTIEIFIYQDAMPLKVFYYGSGEIEIGYSGIVVGNVVANTIKNLDWPSGKTKVDVYANSPKDNATQIFFVLSKL
jgi:hypothetical protein